MKNIKAMSYDFTIQEELLISNLGITKKTFIELKEIFDLVDLDHGGSIQASELQELIKTLGVKKEGMVDKIMKEFGDNDIPFESFCSAMTRKQESPLDLQEVKDAFLYLFGKQTVPVDLITTILQKYIHDETLNELVKSVFPNEMVNLTKVMENLIEK